MQQEIRHPISGEVIKGRLLTIGYIRYRGDLYSSSSGKWEPCPEACLGKPVEEGLNNVLWVRPTKDFTHPKSGKIITGYEIKPGIALQVGDMVGRCYDWEEIKYPPCVGCERTPPFSCSSVFIRPVK